MKYTVPLTLLVAAISVDAAAISEESKRWCSTTGQACDTVKRAADAFADALSTAQFDAATWPPARPLTSPAAS